MVIYLKNLDEHLLLVSLVLEALGNAGMTFSKKKNVTLLIRSVELLGRRVNRLGLSTQEDKVRAITQLPYPKKVGEVSEIYGQFNYHRDFIKDFAEIAVIHVTCSETTNLNLKIYLNSRIGLGYLILVCSSDVSPQNCHGKKPNS